MRSEVSAAPDVERMVTEYGDSLLRMGFLYLGDIHLAQDALQDTLIKAFSTASRYGGRSSEKTWLTRIMINTCKNYRRSRWWRQTELSDTMADIPVEKPEPEDDRVLRAVMALPDKYREVILLHYYQELKIREMAEALGCPESTVSVRLKRARERLKADWKGDMFDE